MNPVTLNLYSSPVRAIPSPLNPLNPLNLLNLHALQGVSNGDIITFGVAGPVNLPLLNPLNPQALRACP